MNEIFGNPNMLALLGMSQGLLQAGSPSSMPISTGGALAQGMQGALSGYITGQGIQQRNMAMQAAQAKQKALQDYAATLPPDQLPAFLANPEGFLKPQKVGAGESVTIGGKPMFSLPANPTLVQVPVPNQPGVTQPTWMRPGDPTGTAVGGQAQPEILNPAVLAAREQLARAGATTVNNNINSFTPASEAAQTEFMRSTRTNYDALRTAPVMIENLSKATELARSGNPFVGAFGTQKAAIAQFFNNNLGTNIAPDSIADAGELKNRLFQQIMDNLKKLDAAPSQMQQQMMQEALGTLNTDPKALEKIMGVTEEVVRGKVDVHNKEVKSALDRGVKFPYDPVIQLPTRAPKAPPTEKTAPTFPAPSRDAIKRLKMNPKERSMFEAVFGPGSATTHLGK
jgi:hypothetical protein